MLNQVTAVCVTHNTKKLFERCFNAFRKFYPHMNLIIVDGSNESDPCYKYVVSLADAYTRVFHSDLNIGHGRGLVFALGKVDTPFALIFDSDTEILSPVVQDMLDMMEEDTLGVGNIEKTAFDGFEWGCKPEHLNQGHMRYLHPFFCLIQLKEYYKYRPYIHHGAPAVNLCLDVHNRGLSEKVIKEFPVWHTAGKGWVWEGKPNKYVRHDTQGTRAERKRRDLPEIESKWEKVINDGPIPPGKISVITCTGDRPFALMLCARWINNQILKPHEWIVVDDGQEPVSKDLLEKSYVKYVRRIAKPNDPDHTLVPNLMTAFQHVTGDYILFMEDDEYYSPKYILEMVKRLETYKYVGIGRSRYYHLPGRKYSIHGNMEHASLAQTAIRKDVLDKVLSVLPGTPFFDLRLWGAPNNKEAIHIIKSYPLEIKERVGETGESVIFDDHDDPLYVGMKGLPGRAGIGSGHAASSSWYKDDPEGIMLRKWIKNKKDYDFYIQKSLAIKNIKRR